MKKWAEAAQFSIDDARQESCLLHCWKLSWAIKCAAERSASVMNPIRKHGNSIGLATYENIRTMIWNGVTPGCEQSD